MPTESPQFRVLSSNNIITFIEYQLTPFSRDQSLAPNGELLRLRFIHFLSQCSPNLSLVYQRQASTTEYYYYSHEGV